MRENRVPRVTQEPRVTASACCGLSVTRQSVSPSVSRFTVAVRIFAGDGAIDSSELVFVMLLMLNKCFVWKTERRVLCEEDGVTCNACNSLISLKAGRRLAFGPLGFLGVMGEEAPTVWWLLGQCHSLEPTCPLAFLSLSQQRPPSIGGEHAPGFCEVRSEVGWGPGMPGSSPPWGLAEPHVWPHTGLMSLLPGKDSIPSSGGAAANSFTCGRCRVEQREAREGPWGGEGTARAKPRKPQSHGFLECRGEGAGAGQGHGQPRSGSSKPHTASG